MAIGYSLVQYNGEFYSDGTPKLITLRIQQAMHKTEEALKYPVNSLTLEQGCHHDGTLSGGTHAKADVFDLSYDKWEDKANALMLIGVIPFVRTYNWDGKQGGAHIHCLVRGSESFSSEAAAQIPDWDKHLDGLYYHRPYDPSLPWGPVKDFKYDPHWKPGGDQGQGGNTKQTWPALIEPTRHAFLAKNGWDAFAKAHPNMNEPNDIADDMAALWKRMHDFVYPA